PGLPLPGISGVSSVMGLFGRKGRREQALNDAQVANFNSEIANRAGELGLKQEMQPVEMGLKKAQSEQALGHGQWWNAKSETEGSKVEQGNRALDIKERDVASKEEYRKRMAEIKANVGNGQVSTLDPQTRK